MLTHPGLIRLEKQIGRIYESYSELDFSELSDSSRKLYQIGNDALRRLRAKLESLGPNPSEADELAVADELAENIADCIADS